MGRLRNNVIRNNGQTRGQIDAALKRHRSHAVTDREWGLLDNRDNISLKIAKGETTHDLVAVRLIQDREAFGSAQQARQPAQPMLSRRQLESRASADLRIFAISRLTHGLAGQREDVRNFRAQILGGILIQFSDVQNWVASRSQSSPSLILRLPLPQGITITRSGTNFLLSEPIQRLEGFSTERDMLDYFGAGDGWVRSEAVSRDSELDRLRKLSLSLAADYGWQRAQATVFVLTGLVPTVAECRVTYETKEAIAPLRRITLTIDPALSPQRVMRIYAIERSKVRGRRSRPLGGKNTTLVFFHSTRPTETYAQSMKAWNAKYPEWRYKHASNFGRDVKRSRERLLMTGPTIDAGLQAVSPRPARPALVGKKRARNLPSRPPKRNAR
jgi:hypothetical protein